jgi:hypothetical protein
MVVARWRGPSAIHSGDTSVGNEAIRWILTLAGLLFVVVGIPEVP